MLKNRAFTGRSYGKSKSVALMLLARVPPSEACKPPAPKGSSDSAFEKKKRAEILSLELRNSRSQLAVNWSSVYFPGRLITNRASGYGEPTETLGSPGREGMRKPFASPPNWLLLKFNN